ncbi:MAG: helix-turn-helix transcriptional regulator [Candidatus Micrarchaeia archaeon]
MATLTSYIDDTASVVYVIRTNETRYTMDIDFGTVVYAVSDQGDVKYSVENGTLSLFGNSTFYIVKVKYQIPETDGYREFVLYTKGLNVSEHKLYYSPDVKLYKVYPEGKITSDSIVWEGPEPVYIVRYGASDSSGFMLYLVIVFLLLVSYLIYMKIFAGKKHGKSEIWDVDDFEKKIAALSGYEKEILRAVRQNPGIKQKELSSQLNMRKSHLSKVLGRMEARFLVRRERFGKVIKIYLGGFFDKKPEVSKVS